MNKEVYDWSTKLASDWAAERGTESARESARERRTESARESASLSESLLQNMRESQQTEGGRSSNKRKRSASDSRTPINLGRRRINPPPVMRKCGPKGMELKARRNSHTGVARTRQLYDVIFGDTLLREEEEYPELAEAAAVPQEDDGVIAYDTIMTLFYGTSGYRSIL